ncbi:MAG: hypothetical protein AAFQ74_04610 [Cyanobacteria bacterium J06623_4]
MAKLKTKKTFRWQIQKPILAAALAFAGVFNMMSAVLAAGTPAGTGIENTATATYDDGTNNFEAISNTVTINVAEVAGLRVDIAGNNDVNNGSVVNNDIITFDYRVTNTGNAPTFVHVPGANDIGVTFGNILRVDVVDPGTATQVGDSTDPTVAIPPTIAGVPATGSSTENLVTGDANLQSGPGMANGGVIAPDAFFTVRVTVQVTGTGVGDDVGVQFGNTLDNTTAPADGTQNQQNIADSTDAGQNSDDVRTLNEGAQAPTNGEREAANFQEVEYATNVDPDVAQASIFKTSAHNDNGTDTNPNDDTITYNLSYQVGNATFTGVNPGDLEGTNITLDGSTQNRILISDAIPENTVYDDTFTPTSPGPNWVTVYSTDDPALTGNNPLQAAWTTTEPAAASVRRIGFVFDTTANGVRTPGPVVTGFSFRVATTGLPTTSNSNIANIAQIFGETAGDPGDNIVYDESGDQRPNNLDDGADITGVAPNFDPVNDDGIADELDPEENLNANDGTGNDGESNVVPITVNVIPVTPGDLLNGPAGTIGAIGPADNNDDFTNVATPVAGPDVGIQDATTGDPGSITITNTVGVPGTAANQLDTITLLPLTPGDAADLPDFLDDGDETNDSWPGAYGPVLPDGTVVTITHPNSGNTATYTVTGGAYTTTDAPVEVGTITPGNTEDYTVQIDLPVGTPQIRPYELPIVAFVDNDSSGSFTPTTENIANITVDRVYTGFMTLLKEANVQGTRADGSVINTGFLQDFSAITDVRPGDNITYRITYQNISEDGSDTIPATTPAPVGNILLNANSFILTEDGNAVTNGGTNNWATTTLHQLGTAASSGAGTVEFFNVGTSLGTTEPAAETTGPSAVTIYRNDVGTVAPQTTGTLEFIRQVQ